MSDCITIQIKHLAIFCVAFFLIIIVGGGFVANTYIDKYEAILAENLELRQQLSQSNDDIEQRLKEAERTLEWLLL